MKRRITAALGVSAFVGAALVLTPAVAQAAQACTNLQGPAGGSLPLCKTWNWDGNDYDGRWWTNGPSSLPSYTYLQRREDGTIYNSAYSGSYNDRSRVHFRLCDSRVGRCNGWW